MATNELEKNQNYENQLVIIRSSVTNELAMEFEKVGFTHHFEILSKTKTIEERVFYIQKTASEFWSVTTLRYHLKSNLFQQQGTLPNNFAKAITQDDLRAKALVAFKD